MAVNACESIDGLNGFVGVDLLIANDDDIYPVYLLELNSRFTTPYVGLRKITDFNITKTIIEGNVKDIDLSLNGEVEFKKESNNLNIRRI